MLRNWLQEPLVHFLALGALLFLGYGVINNDPAMDDDNIIQITQGDQQRLSAEWSRQWGRAPTAAELDGLVSALVREEILYREALALGLDQDDTIIRRRLAQKMEFLTEDLATSAEPTDAALRDFYAENASRFAEPPTLSFMHVYINADQRKAGAAATAAAVLEQLRDGAAPETLGDRIMLESNYARLDQQGVSRLFGERFAASLFALDDDSWQGPVKSGYGLHLVRITERIAGRIPEFDEVADQMLAEYRYEQRERANAQVYETLREQYDVRVEDAG